MKASRPRARAGRPAHRGAPARRFRARAVSRHMARPAAAHAKAGACVRGLCPLAPPVASPARGRARLEKTGECCLKQEACGRQNPRSPIAQASNACLKSGSQKEAKPGRGRAGPKTPIHSEPAARRQESGGQRAHRVASSARASGRRIAESAEAARAACRARRGRRGRRARTPAQPAGTPGGGPDRKKTGSDLSSIAKGARARRLAVGGRRCHGSAAEPPMRFRRGI